MPFELQIKLSYSLWVFIFIFWWLFIMQSVCELNLYYNMRALSLVFITYRCMWESLGAHVFVFLQVRLCREKSSGNIYAMKKLKKSEMLSRGQVKICYHYHLQWAMHSMLVEKSFFLLNVFHMLCILKSSGEVIVLSSGFSFLEWMVPVSVL